MTQRGTNRSATAPTANAGTVPVPVLTAAEMRVCDQVTAEQYGVSTLALMRSAAKVVTEFALGQFPLARRITVLCGHGNNGGDGLMVARLLANSGLEVTVLLTGASDDLKGDAATAWAELGGVEECHDSHSLPSGRFGATRGSARGRLIVDAIVGTGFPAADARHGIGRTRLDTKHFLSHSGY